METSNVFSESPDVEGFSFSVFFTLTRAWVIITSLGKQFLVIGVAEEFSSLWSQTECA